MADKISDLDDLNLPCDPEFLSTPPVYTLAEMVKICEAMLPYWNKKRFSEPLPELIDLGPFKLD